MQNEMNWASGEFFLDAQENLITHLQHQGYLATGEKNNPLPMAFIHAINVFLDIYVIGISNRMGHLHQHFS